MGKHSKVISEMDMGFLQSYERILSEIHSSQNRIKSNIYDPKRTEREVNKLVEKHKYWKAFNKIKTVLTKDILLDDTVIKDQCTELINKITEFNMQLERVNVSVIEKFKYQEIIQVNAEQSRKIAALKDEMAKLKILKQDLDVAKVKLAAADNKIAELTVENKKLKDNIEAKKLHIIEKPKQMEKGRSMAIQLIKDLNAISDNKFVIRNYNLTDENAWGIAEFFQDNSKISQLSIVNCGLTNSGATAIGQVISKNTMITLNLRNNKIADAGAIGIAERIKNTSQLQILDLHNNVIGNDGSLALADAILLNKSIVELDVNENYIYDIGVLALADAANKTMSLKRLYIFDGNYITEDTKKRIIANKAKSLNFITEYSGLDGSKIVIDIEDRMLLHKWVAEAINADAKFSNLWKREKNGYASLQFHSQCDDKGHTLIVIMSESGHIFGGFTKLSWKGPNAAYHYDPDAFIFSLAHRTKHAKQKGMEQSVQTWEGHG